LAYESVMEAMATWIIQRQLGHASLAITDGYVSHIAPKDLIEAIGKRKWTTCGRNRGQPTALCMNAASR
jgi:integrase